MLCAGADNVIGSRAVLLVAHGSRDPRAEGSVTELADGVRRRLPERTVVVAHLDFNAPTVPAALRELAARGSTEVVVVPLLFAPGYHLQIDLPKAISDPQRPKIDVKVAGPLAAAPAPGAPDLLLAALESRLGDRAEYDAVVLASAGTSDLVARAAVEELAERWARRLSKPVLAAYATACAPTVSDAIALLRGSGARRVAVSGLFVAPGRLPEAVRRAAEAEDVTVVGAPLGSSPELVELVASRATG